MRQRTYKTLLCLMLLCATCAMPARAGEWYCESDSCPTEFDWQWFAPIHDVCSIENPKAREGYFFSTDVMHFWMSRPDRAAIGNTGAVNAWIPETVDLVFFQNPNGGVNTSTILPIVNTGAFGLQFNSIDDAYTETGEGWGNRVEFGHVNDDCGWMISIMGGIDVANNANYGFDDKRLDQLGAAQGLDGVDGDQTPTVDTNNDGIINNLDNVNPVAPVAGNQAILPIDGLTGVQILFNDPFGTLQGFVDDNGDQLPDDLNGDGVVDNNDLVRIGVVFDDMTVRNETNLDGVEAMMVRRKRRLNSGFDVEGYLGARYLQLDDRFSVVARGGALADSDWTNNAENRIFGPTFGFRATRQKRQWVTSIQAKFLAGANLHSIRQHGFLASHIGTGAAGVPESFGGNVFFHRLGDARFSPVGEFRFDTACQLTRHVSVRAGWTGMIIGNIARASNTVVYDLPALGIRDGREEVFAHSLSFGIDINR